MHLPGDGSQSLDEFQRSGCLVAQDLRECGPAIAVIADVLLHQHERNFTGGATSRSRSRNELWNCAKPRFGTQIAIHIDFDILTRFEATIEFGHHLRTERDRGIALLECRSGGLGHGIELDGRTIEQPRFEDEAAGDSRQSHSMPGIDQKRTKRRVGGSVLHPESLAIHLYRCDGVALG